MVYQDISGDIKLNNLEKLKSVANVPDRFFSFLIDYFIISPFVFFLIYITFNNGFKFLESNPAAEENFLFFVILAFCSAVYFSLIQSFFIWKWRATPGQYYLKIKIDFQENQSHLFLRAMIRQTSFWLSFALLGIPFLSILAQRSRKAFYDRLANVSVMSKKTEAVFFQFENEYKYWNAVMSTLVVFVGFLFSFAVVKTYSKIVNRVPSFAVLQNKNYFCEEVKNIKLEERLSVAVALNLVNQLSDDCLDKEADFALWKQKKSDYSLAYYAKSLTAENGETERDYLRQSCSGQELDDFSHLSMGCKMSYSFLNNTFDNLYESLDESSFFGAALKYELSVALEINNDVKPNFAKIDKFNTLKLIKKYQIVELLSNQSVQTNRQPASVDSDMNNEMPNNEKLMDLIEEL